MKTQPVRSRDELIGHILALLDDHNAVGTCRQNQDLASFLEAMPAWLSDCEGYSANTGQSVDARQPSWQIFADALSAAIVYE